MSHQWIRHARRIIHDCFQPDPRVYWADLVVSTTIAYAASIAVFELAPFTLAHTVCFLIAGFALYRVGSFMHEIQHFPHNQMRAFTAYWNVTCGIPMLMPAFMYDNHQDHHRRTHYGTDGDGEYLPLGAGPLRHFVTYTAEILLIPAFVAVRFFFLTPISFLHPRLRRTILERYSYYGINIHYRRRLPPGGIGRTNDLLDVACSLRAWAIPASILLGFYSWVLIPELYALGVISLGLNYIRNLAAHRYTNEGEQMSFNEQFADSINIEGRPLLTEILFPVGLRYHALHHLFPNIPYHRLGTAHRRLMVELPADSPYRAATHASFASAVRQLFANSHTGRTTPAKPSAA